MPRTAPQRLLDAALSYARRGWHVFPLYEPIGQGCSCGNRDCAHQGKHPRVASGLKEATTDEATIIDWWTKWPNANIGIRTGAISGINVADVDNRHLGDETRDDLEKIHGSLPLTIEAFTGSGSHLYFAYDEKWKTGTDTAGQGIDTRSDGGYVVAPPSLHVSGCEYAWNVEAHPEDVYLGHAPKWFADLVRAPEKMIVEPPVKLFEGVVDAETVDRDGRKLLSWAMKRIRAGATRNKTGFDLAIQLRDNDIPRHSALMLMRQFQQQVSEIPGYDHPYTAAEAKASYDQAFSHPKRDPIPGIRDEVRKAEVVEPEAAKPKKRFRTFGEILLARDSVGERQPIGFPTLDKVTRGIPRGKVLTIVGRPGAGKTNLGTMLANHFARVPGVEVFCLLPDEGEDASGVRAGQMLGYDRVKLEDRDRETEIAAALDLDRLPLFSADPDDDDAMTLEEFGNMVDAAVADRKVQPVILLDSLQTIKLRDDEDFAKLSEWQQLSETMKWLRRKKRQKGWIVVLVSQATRTAYKKKNAKENDDPLAAGGGSSSIEFQSDVLLYLTGKIDSDVWVEVAKSRIGGQGMKFHIKFDAKKASFYEPAFAVADEYPVDPKEKARLDVTKGKLLKVLRESPGVSSAQLCEMAGVKKAYGLEALKELKDEILVFAEPGPRNSVRWKAANVRSRYEGGSGTNRGGDANGPPGEVAVESDRGRLLEGARGDRDQEGEAGVHGGGLRGGEAVPSGNLGRSGGNGSPEGDS